MIRVEDLRKTYDRRGRNPGQALRGVSFTLPDTGFVCIVGPSGCGKTSLLNAMGGLDSFDGGQVCTDRLDRLRCGERQTEAERDRSFGYIFQNYYLLPEYSAAYNVYLGLHSLKLSHKEKLKRTLEALRAVDMERFARRAVGQLSGGQQQRVAIARALARRPRVIFADEPTGNLDEANTMNICALLRQISRTSLVVMVTHEERVARFFADRIITLEEGQVQSDSESWQRDSLAAGSAQLYTGDFRNAVLQGEGLTLRLFQEEEAAPVDLTLIVQRDRVILKLKDSRAVTCGGPEDPPALIEGVRPVLRLEELDQEAGVLPQEEEAPQGRAGQGLTFPILLGEARNLLRGKGFRRLGSWLFLVIVTVLTLLTVGDAIYLSTLDPESVITTDGHVLEIQLDRGEDLPIEVLTLSEQVQTYMNYLDGAGQDLDYLPQVPVSATYSATSFLQMGSEAETLSGFTYMKLSRLDPSTLILGRMPERPDEIVVDRWVLKALMERTGILQNGISDVAFFLDCTLSYQYKDFGLTIVGISDCGEPDIFLDEAALVSLGTNGNRVITLSQLQRQFPGEYDDVTLAQDQCLMVTNNAGGGYADRVGQVYKAKCGLDFTIQDTIHEPDTYAAMVVADGIPAVMLRRMATERLLIYCPDKAAMLDYLAQGLPEELKGMVQVKVVDQYSDDWNRYLAATRLQMDSRQIVTFTVMALSLVMLYLLRRSQVRERVGMIAVYRLLGIPGRKLSAIFTLECVLLSLTATLPAAVVTGLAVWLASGLPSVQVSLLLPWYAVLGVYLCVLAFHLLASLLPLLRLLRLPPARLAARYDI